MTDRHLLAAVPPLHQMPPLISLWWWTSCRRTMPLSADVVNAISSDNNAPMDPKYITSHSKSHRHYLTQLIIDNWLRKIPPVTQSQSQTISPVSQQSRYLTVDYLSSSNQQCLTVTALKISQNISINISIKIPAALSPCSGIPGLLHLGALISSSSVFMPSSGGSGFLTTKSLT